MSELILTLNAGSSSLKFALYPCKPGAPACANGGVDGLGSSPRLRIEGSQTRGLAADTDGESALMLIFEWIAQAYDADAVCAVGHRVVHGGAQYSAPLRIDAANLDALDALAPLAPLHQQHNLRPIHALRRQRPELLQVACFDTAFHATMPELAQRYGLPARCFDQGVRRYGFHGLSYEHIAGWLAEHRPQAQRVIIAHLGNGASLCALRDGRSVETTMGFSALDGLMMGSRCGSIDPGVLIHLLRQPDVDVDALESLLYRDAGLLGVSGISHDMRVLQQSDQPEARLAIDLFVYRCVRECGALISALGGVDTLVFTAGIGENAAAIRAAIVTGLAWTGLRLDAEANEKKELRISTQDSAVEALVVATDEESVIANHVRRMLAGNWNSEER